MCGSELPIEWKRQTTPLAVCSYVRKEESRECPPSLDPWEGSVLQCVAVCCSVLQCVAVRCSVLQCVAVRCKCFAT